MTSEERREYIIKAYNHDDITLGAIGEKLGISRQRVWQIIKPFPKRLKIKRKLHAMTVIHKEYEDVFERELVKRNAVYEKQGYNSPFDFIVNGKTVEVKRRRVASSSHLIPGYFFANFRSRVHVDIYVFIVGDDLSPDFYIIPERQLPKRHWFVSASPKNKTKKRIYRNNFGMLWK